MNYDPTNRVSVQDSNNGNNSPVYPYIPDGIISSGSKPVGGTTIASYQQAIYNQIYSNQIDDPKLGKTNAQIIRETLYTDSTPHYSLSDNLTNIARNNTDDDDAPAGALRGYVEQDVYTDAPPPTQTQESSTPPPSITGDYNNSGNNPVSVNATNTSVGVSFDITPIISWIASLFSGW